MNDDAAGPWVRVASTGDLAEGEVMAVQVGDEAVALYNLGDGEICATDNICTHEYACLSDGWLEDGVIECPLHAGRFEVRTGKGLGPPIDKDLRVYSVRISGDDILVSVPKT